MSIIHDYASIARTMNCNKPSKELASREKGQLPLLCHNCSTGIPPDAPRFPINSNTGGCYAVGVICPHCYETNTVA